MRAFIALDVPEDVKQRAEALEKNFEMDGITLVKKDALHITLQFLGELNAEQADRTVAAMKKVRFKPFRVSLSGLSYFTPRMIKVIFVEAATGGRELIELYGKVSAELKASGIGFDEEKYAPHLTIARVKWAKEMRRLREMLEKNARAELGSFEATSIALKESTLTAAGPEYRTLYELKF